jgi:3-isopropylmalate/(R)-2-methylmalate dehydratase large subunit
MVPSSGKQNLFNRVWDEHTVRILPSGQTQLFIGQHLIHEVTSPQAFQMLRDRGLKVMYPERTLATVDHIIPTLSQARPFADGLAEEMMSAIEKNCRDFGITLLNLSDKRQGIVHVIGPELGLTRPCGPSFCRLPGISSGNVAFQLLNRLCLTRDDPLHEIANRHHSDYGITIYDGRCRK